MPSTSKRALDRLPDACFAVILSGGKKDKSGKTEPRTLRQLPHHTEECTSGSDHYTVVKSLLKACFEELEDSSLDKAAKTKARTHLSRHAVACGVDVASFDTSAVAMAKWLPLAEWKKQQKKKGNSEDESKWLPFAEWKKKQKNKSSDDSKCKKPKSADGSKCKKSKAECDDEKCPEHGPGRDEDKKKCNTASIDNEVDRPRKRCDFRKLKNIANWYEWESRWDNFLQRWLNIH
jgi:hypothetical protein